MLTIIFSRWGPILILALSFIWLAADGRAGLVAAPATCDEACAAAITRFAQTYMAEHAPALAVPAETFEAASLDDGKACPARKQPGPAVFGVMIGPDAISGFTGLAGPANDLQLMRQVMHDRGVAPDFISSVEGAAADRTGMLAAMAKPLPCLRERDQLVLIYSGWGTVYPYEWFDSASVLDAFCAAPKAEAGLSICQGILAADVSEAYLASLRDAVSIAISRWLQIKQPGSYHLPGMRQHVLIGTGSRSNGKGEIERLDGITASDISNFVTRIRNRGADAFLIVDTRMAASEDLLALQREASAPAGWAAYGNTVVQNGGFPPVQNDLNTRGPVPLFGNGEFAVLYASVPDGQAYEYQQGGEAKQLGALIFRVAEVLRADAAIKFKDLSLAIARSFDAYNKTLGSSYAQEPVFMASNLDLTLLAPRIAPAPRKSGEIEIISPSPKRGATEIEEQSFTVAARYAGAAKARMAIIDGELVPVDSNGQFRRDIIDASGKFAIAIRVLGANYETLAATDLHIRDKPAEPVVSSPARKLALIIANQTYADLSFPPLTTPIADAEAIAALLTSRFGFATTMAGGGEPLNLFLRDAGKAQIQQTLYEVRRRLTAEDQLLIYYAGHGENDPDLGAYWVPADGEANHDYSWISADDITRELKRMNALSVLVISDSCYAGGLSRGAAEERPAGAARTRYLAKASRMKARQLMASGGEEPVEDGGGGGHSIFAKALIEALQHMPEATFTANELFESKVKPAVISAANATSEGQIPGFHRISRAGDEPGSEFIFQAQVAPQ